MKDMNLIIETAVRDGNGNTIWYKDDNGNFKKSLTRNYQIASKNKSSKGKSYFVEDRVYYKYLEIKQKK
jgi:hypothetical protein